MKALMKGGERDFAEVMTRLVSCNHFLPERMALEREALGSAFVDEGAAWNLNFDSSSRSPNIQRLTEVARTEPNPELRRAAIHSLGISGQQSGPALVAIYQNDKDRSIRETVLQALFVQGNARALIRSLARKLTRD